MRKSSWQSNKYIIVAAILGSILIFAAGFLVRYLDYSITVYSQIISALILYLTAVIVFWYAKESAESNKLHLEELEAKIMPYLRLQWSKAGGCVFEIVNDGNGIALDVSFSQMVFVDNVLKSKFQIKSRPLIAPNNASSIVSVEELKEDAQGIVKIDNFNIKGYLFDKLDLAYKIKVQYKDIKDNIYEAIFVADQKYNDKFRIKSQKRVKTN